MYVKVLRIQRFRGFRDLTIKPKGHVVVMGPPSSGRSDLMEALVRVLDPEASRTRTTTEIDFFNKQTSQPIQIEVTLADLGPDLEQRFFDQLELWDREKYELVEELDTPDEIDLDNYEWVLRIEHRATWLDEEEIAEESLSYSKNADALSVQARVRQADVRELGFSLVRQQDRRVLDLGSRSPFRTAVDNAPGEDFATAISEYVKDVSEAALRLMASTQLQDALGSVFTPVADVPGVSAAKPIGFVQFGPEGGSVNGLLRSLAPTIDQGNGSGALPVWRQGSTLMNLVRIGETLAHVRPQPRILAIDDLGDGLSTASAAHVVSQPKRTASQLWISTRLPVVAEVFDPQEIVRLGRDEGGARNVNAGPQPATKADGVASKHWHRSLLPALPYRSVVVLEGPNDFTVVQSLSLRLLAEVNHPLLASRSMAIVQAGTAGGGGYPTVIKLAAAAREMGLRAIGVVDGDKRPETTKILNEWLNRIDVLVRLPDGMAIEAALVSGIAESVLRQALDDLVLLSGGSKPPNSDQSHDTAFEKLMISYIKENSLHGQFVDILPQNNIPPLAKRLIDVLAELATSTQAGMVQL